MNQSKITSKTNTKGSEKGSYAIESNSNSATNITNTKSPIEDEEKAFQLPEAGAADKERKSNAEELKKQEKRKAVQDFIQNAKKSKFSEWRK